MIEFITNPIVEVLDDQWSILRADFVVKYYDHTFVIEEGFMTDFASVPRVPVFYALFANRAKKSAVLHDYLYTNRLYSRAECDKAFLCAMEAEGLPWVVRQAMYRGVRLGGGSHYKAYDGS